MRLTCVVGARPNFVKAASLLRAAASFDGLRIRLVHTGQHYDRAMSDVFFDELGLPAPDAWLGVGPGTHAVQTARLLESLDGDLAAHPADCVVVVGDVNSTMAGALVAAKRGVRVAHVEAGLRSRDRRMPEELNRIVTDQLADDLFTTEPSATTNLLAEGIAADRIHFVGNVMVDTLLQHRERARRRDILARLGCEPRAYAVCTLHRPANVDTPAAAVNTVRAVEAVAARLRVIFPLHPRTRSALAAAGVLARLESHPGMRLTDPLGYLDFLALMDRARLVFTDSGGIQEETTVLGVPCLTFRDTTERPITVSRGSNRLVGLDPARAAAAVDAVLAAAASPAVRPDLWDGHAAERVLQVLVHGRQMRTAGTLHAAGSVG